MRVLHVIPSVAQSSGGTTSALFTMIEALQAEGCTVEIATSDDGGKGHRLAPDAAERRLANVHFFLKRTDFYTMASGFSAWLEANLERFDLVHVHALFSHMSVIAAYIARKQGKPYIVTPHGLLNRYGIAHKPVLKKLSMAMFERQMIEGASAIHLTSKSEARDFSILGIPAIAEIIPLAVDFPASGNQERFLERHPSLRDSRIAIFVGRLNPVKNLENLLSAFSELVPFQRQLRLVLVGTGDPNYVSKLKALSLEYNLSDQIVWTGHLGGTEKADALAAADFYVQPSHSESFGISLVEALSIGLPCVASDGVALADELASEGLIYLTSTRAESIARGMECAIRETGNANPRRGALIVRERFDRKVFATRLMALYQRLLPT